MLNAVVRALSLLTPRTLQIVSVLAQAGHGVDPQKVPDVVERAKKLIDSARTRNKAIGSYLDFHSAAMPAMGLDPAKPADVVRHLSLPRCGLPDVLPARASECRWGHEPVTTALGRGWEGLKLFTPDQIRSAIEWSNGRWAAVGGSVWRWHRPGDPGPNQLVHYTPIDGPSNVLADQILPCNVGRDTECRMRIDSGEFGRGGLYERLGYEYFRAVVTHEDGHKWGHDHSRDPNSLMYPMARPEVLDLGGDDMERHRSTYGPPKVVPPLPKPQPDPPPSGPAFGHLRLTGSYYGDIRKQAGTNYLDGGRFVGEFEAK